MAGSLFLYNVDLATSVIRRSRLQGRSAKPIRANDAATFWQPLFFRDFPGRLATAQHGFPFDAFAFKPSTPEPPAAVGGWAPDSIPEPSYQFVSGVWGDLFSPIPSPEDTSIGSAGISVSSAGTLQLATPQIREARLTAGRFQVKFAIITVSTSQFQPISAPLTAPPTRAKPAKTSVWGEFEADLPHLLCPCHPPLTGSHGNLQTGHARKPESLWHAFRRLHAEMGR